MTDLPAVAVEIVSELGDAHVEALATAYRPAPRYTAAGAAAAREAVPAPHQDHVDPLNNAWALAPDVPGAAIAFALEAALTAKRLAARSTIEIVVTGPDSPVAPVRLTSEVVRQLIDSAVQRVTLVSFAAYGIASVISALERAAARGVQIDFILESPEYLVGGGGAAAYSKYRTFEWPTEERGQPDAKLHAKAVIVDSRDVLLTSANMTNAAYDNNMELGLLCRGGDVASRVQKHFDALIGRGVLHLVT